MAWNPRFGTFEEQREYYREFIGARRIDLTEEQARAAAVYLLNNDTNWVGAVKAVLGASYTPYPDPGAIRSITAEKGLEG